MVISVEVGDRLALWDMDRKIPQQYGIQQVYGENRGPGGLFHALRIIPPILQICVSVMDHAPDATIFNYSNPMSRITTTVHRAFLGTIEPKIAPFLHERAVPIMEGMITNQRYEEPAVNSPNAGFITDFPPWIAVEVPAMVDANGVQGIAVDMPVGARGLLSNQVGIHNLRAEEISHERRDLVIQALLVDPAVTVSNGIPALVDHMIAEKGPCLDYLT